ncbi:MAG: hypothetical protein ABI758_06915 [Candidatus Woesebacteria bacterium]
MANPEGVQIPARYQDVVIVEKFGDHRPESADSKLKRSMTDEELEQHYTHRNISGTQTLENK